MDKAVAMMDKAIANENITIALPIEKVVQVRMNYRDNRVQNLTLDDLERFTTTAQENGCTKLIFLTSCVIAEKYLP